ncbi:hypothetical protein AHAS_Ahas11G0224800 [Arachis hypogaea]
MARATDAECALKYLSRLKSNDASTFWKDVLGFDATYGRNQHKCLLVIFSRVDHHMRTLVFGCAILSNEAQDSYVSLLRAFLEALQLAPVMKCNGQSRAAKVYEQVLFMPYGRS